MQLLFSAPISQLSLGQVSYNFLREMWKRDYDVGYLPIGNVDLTAFQPPQEFVGWLQKSIDQRIKLIKKDVPAIKVWHINQDNFLGPKQNLLTFHETSAITQVEKNLVELNGKTFFCGQYSKNLFQNNGVANVETFNLGFDEDFKIGGQKILDATNWGLIGKWEMRKNTHKIINLWVKKYGNNAQHSLTLCVNNPFFSPEDNQKLLINALEGKRYWNVNIIPPLRTNVEVAALQNSIDIDLSGASFSESWGLPAFNAMCLGKWSVVTNYGGHKSWANADNSVLLETEGFQDAEDGVFFRKGGDFSQGQFSYYSDEALVAAMERAEQKVGTVNEAGLVLGKEMTYSKSLDNILSKL
jgi:hypothetical protein